MRERRRYPRVAEHLQAQVVRGPEQIACSTVDISCGGALCRLRHAMPVMTKVAVALALPARLIHCRGVVVRCEPSRDGAAAARRTFRIAILFLELTREDHRAIAEFVLEAMLGRTR